ncbi:MAG: hypothetical protein WCS94_25655, partial [Verrucomicrobiota bacterium]
MKTQSNHGQGWLIAIFLLLSILAHATTITWINPLGGNWSVASNWSPSQVPGADDTAVINIDGNYTVALDTTAS